MLLYRICKHSEIEYNKLLMFNKFDFEQNGVDSYGAVLKSVGSHVSSDYYKRKNKKPFKSFSKCPILLYSHLKRNESPSKLRDLSLVAIEVDPGELDTLDCAKGSLLSLQEISSSEPLLNLQLSRLCVDLTNKQQNGILGIPSDGMRSKYGGSRAEVVFYNERSIEVSLELPASFFIEVFDAFSRKINRLGNFHVRQQCIAGEVWRNGGIDKRENTDKFIRKATYDTVVYTLINDCTKDMCQTKSPTDDYMVPVCPVLARLNEYLDYGEKGADVKIRSHPIYQRNLQTMRTNIGTDWCRGWECQKYCAQKKVDSTIL